MAYAAITKPGDYFNTKLYTGNGSTQQITNWSKHFNQIGVWIKIEVIHNHHCGIL